MVHREPPYDLYALGRKKEEVIFKLLQKIQRRHWGEKGRVGKGAAGSRSFHLLKADIFLCFNFFYFWQINFYQTWGLINALSCPLTHVVETWLDWSDSDLLLSAYFFCLCWKLSMEAVKFWSWSACNIDFDLALKAEIRSRYWIWNSNQDKADGLALLREKTQECEDVEKFVAKVSWLRFRICDRPKYFPFWYIHC